MKSSTCRVATASLVAAAVVSMAAAAPAPSQAPALKGGTYRVAWEGSTDNFWARDGFDPTSEFLRSVRAIHTNLVVRTLVGYDHVAGAAGRRIVPDLAVNVPAPTNGGRTYRFVLKRGVRFGPPVNRAIVSGDIRYAIERLARPRNQAVYWPQFRVIEGFDAYRAGKAPSISGIKTPSPRTIVFTLTAPSGDFLHRIALPAAGPIPREVAKCFEGKPGLYSEDVVASGPYMIEGAREVRLGSCEGLRKMRGNSQTRLVLVRNPNYDPRTDRQAAREANPDRFVFLPAGNTHEIVGKLDSGELEDALLETGASSRTALLRYANSARKRGVLRLNSAAWVHYISINVTRPPFDDVHVRRALSWVIDKAALREAFGGLQAGPIAGHIVPDEILGGRLRGFAPFATRGDHGDLARAKAEMAKSKYATRGGVCVDKACKRVNFSPWLHDLNFNAGERMGPVIKASATRIGLHLVQRSRPWEKSLEPANNIPMTPSTHWLPDFPDPSNFVDLFFAGPNIRPEFNLNTSLLGLTVKQAKRLGVEGRVGRVPSVDADIARCTRLIGDARLDCYAALDRKLSEQIVPWIPFLWRNRITILGPQVGKWGFDQAAGQTAYAHVAVKRS